MQRTITPTFGAALYTGDGYGEHRVRAPIDEFTLYRDRGRSKLINYSRDLDRTCGAPGALLDYGCEESRFSG
jgi:hypothetical protein